MICPKCKTGTMMRVEREGYLEKNWLARWGYFPWLCAECKRRVLMKGQSEDGQVGPSVAARPVTQTQ
jgi:hypothetical protein